VIVACSFSLSACTDNAGVGAVRAGGDNSAPTIVAVSPIAGPIGTQVTITGSGFSREGNTVRFGPGYFEQVRSADRRTLVFAVTDCYNIPHLGACPPVSPGPHDVRVVNANGTSNGIVFTVTGR
jgi:hypothetical protein